MTQQQADGFALDFDDVECIGHIHDVVQCFRSGIGQQSTFILITIIQAGSIQYALSENCIVVANKMFKLPWSLVLLALKYC